MEPEGPKTYSPIRATSRPYVINGQRYEPQHHYELQEEGLASHYGGHDDRCHGSLTSTGERFSMNGLTAAHKTLPLPSVVKVENLENGRCLVLKVNDRGPFIKNRIIDVSARAAHLLGFYHKGIARVRVTALVAETLALPENRTRKISEKTMVCAIQKDIKKRGLASKNKMDPTSKKLVATAALPTSVSTIKNKKTAFICPQPTPIQAKLPYSTHTQPLIRQVALSSAKKSSPPSKAPIPSSQTKLYLSIKARSVKEAQRIENSLKSYGIQRSAQSVSIRVGPFKDLSHLRAAKKKIASLKILAPSNR